jgi:hypothetical protein
MSFDFFNIKKRPVVIISGPRTGSTALAYHIANLYPTVPFFNEPNFTPALMDKFIDYSIATKKNDYILKLLGSALNSYPADTIATIFSNETFRIKISRRNIIEQMASYYVALCRDMWIYTETDRVYQDLTTIDIEFDFIKIRHSIGRVLHDNDILSKISADVELYYEDFTDILSPIKKTPLPANYDSLLDIIKKLYRPAVN